jgi:hypothetical protein
MLDSSWIVLGHSLYFHEGVAGLVVGQRKSYCFDVLVVMGLNIWTSNVEAHKTAAVSRVQVCGASRKGTKTPVSAARDI